MLLVEGESKGSWVVSDRPYFWFEVLSVARGKLFLEYLLILLGIEEDES